MYGFKYVRDDLQRELLSRARAEGIGVSIDPNGFVVVDGKDDHLRLEAIHTSIDQRILVDAWYFSTGTLEGLRRERDTNAARRVPFIEYEDISDLPSSWRMQPGAPRIRHSYGLAIRRESSLPRGQRAWDRE